MEIFYFIVFGAISIVVAALELSKNNKDRINTTSAFNSFKNNYIVVYSLMMAGDWLQGPYVYFLYTRYGFGKGDIGRLFIAGFGSSMLFGTIVGSLADKQGRKRACITYCITYILSCITKHSPQYKVLMLGRILGGIATSLLFSAFESWLVAEHNKVGSLVLTLAREEIGYDGWRLDFARGFWGGYVKDYIDASEPYFAVGEYWDSLSYTYGAMDHNQDGHRQRIVDWINATNGTAGAFDVTTKGILHAALERCEYWRLSDQKGQPPGVVGWWPSRAVTFIENHDTGSTQGHWRFPSGKEMQGYAYILTHPGTPAVFFDHIFSHYQHEIKELITLRHRTKVHCRSTVKITKAERDVYAANIDEKVIMKIGPGHFEPPSGPHKWALAVEGRDYKVWEAS